MKIIEEPTEEYPEGSECPVHKRVHNSHGWYVCDPFPTAITGEDGKTVIAQGGPTKRPTALSYKVTREAWYHVEGEVGDKNEIMVGTYVPDGGCEYEFAIRWQDFGKGKGAMRVEVFDDAWQAFNEQPGFFAQLGVLARDGDLTFDKVREWLRQSPLADTTDRDRDRP